MNNFRISSGVRASVFGGSLTEQEIRKFRRKYNNEDRNRNEPETKN